MTSLSLLPPNATAFELAIEKAIAARIGSIPVPIADIDNPQLTPIHALPFLAYERSTAFWRDAWSEATRRKAASEAIHLNRRSGSLAAIEGWLALVGAAVVDVVAPPAGCYASRGRSPEQRAAWLGRFAELRITLRQAPGPGDAGTFYADSRRDGLKSSLIGHRFALRSTARQRYGRQASIVDGGVSTPVLWSTAGIIEVDGLPVPIERVIVPGKARRSELFSSRCVLGRVFAERRSTTSKIFSLGPDRQPISVPGRLLTYSATPLDVITIVPERVYGRAETKRRPVFVGRSIAAFAAVSTAAERVFDRFRIFDASRVPAKASASYGTFVGQSRPAITPFRADLRVSLPGAAPRKAARTGAIVGMFPRPSSGRLALIADAVRAGKAARDKIYFTATTRRPVTFNDGIPIDGGFAFGGLLTIARGSA